jgi:hypothetical protein
MKLVTVQFLQPPAASSRVRMFSFLKDPQCMLPFNMTVRVQHKYRTRSQIVFLYVPVFIFIGRFRTEW